MASVKAVKHCDGTVVYRVRYRAGGRNPVAETFYDAASAQRFADLVDRGGGAAAREMRFLTPDEYARLHAHIPTDYQPFVAAMYGLGLRFGEATALTVADLDLDVAQPVVRVNKAWKMGENGAPYLGAPKTKRARRTVTIPAPLVPVLRAALADVMSITNRFSKWPIFSGFFTMVNILCLKLATCLASRLACVLFMGHTCSVLFLRQPSTK